MPTELESISLFDRAAHRRKDREFLNEMLAAPSAFFVPVWRSQSFVHDDSGSYRVPQLTLSPDLVERADEIVWLGMRGETPCFALDFSSMAEPLGLPGLAGAGQFNDLRLMLSVLPDPDIHLLAYGRALLHWHRTQRFCGKCGQRTHAKEGGHVRECEGCETRYFPRTDPAVMVLITHGSSCLLARQPGFPKGMYSALAGFVEPGESLEQTVVREAFEEVGLSVEPLGYLGSQPWPFPASLMVGFRARATQLDLVIDHEELEDARWVSRDELREPQGFFIPPPFSLAHRLISDFVAEGT